MKTTESGYLVKIEVFIPANPRRPASMQAAADALGKIAEATVVGMSVAGIRDCSVTAGEPVWQARRRNPAPITSASAEPTAQEPAGGDAPTPTPSPVGVSLPAGDHMPDLPAGLDRRTRESLPT